VTRALDSERARLHGAGGELHLNVNVTGAGRHPGGWRSQDDPELFTKLDFFLEIARLAELGTFDAVFLADFSAVPQEPPAEPFQSLDNSVLLGALAAVTEHVGLVATASTTYNDPFNIARRIATLDHVSRGRAALNLVTTYSRATAANYSVSAHPDHAARYGRAEEFVDVVGKLWDSWEDDAIIGDRDNDIFVAADRVHTIDHVGEHFSVRGPAVVPRSPQGRPVIFQAGSSEPGRQLGSRAADAIFTHQASLAGAQEFYADMKRRATAFGRDPERLLIMPGFFPIVGSTEAEARTRKEELLAVYSFDREVDSLAAKLGLRRGDLELDERIPYELVAEANNDFNGSHGMLEGTIRLATEHDYTVRELLLDNGGFHRQIVGAPEQIADHIQTWFEGGAADGFNLNFGVFPTDLRLFVDHVIPELRRRGIFRREYSGATLRDHLGLTRPPSRYATTATTAPPIGSTT
jgi:FMN-dependent oxidoreductase (nitrilotriacetate monooxygenase family)